MSLYLDRTIVSSTAVRVLAWAFAAAGLSSSSTAQGYLGWAQHPTTFAPSARAGHVMAYDAARNRMVLYGGLSSATPVCCPLADTWEWDGAAWVLKQPNTFPAARMHAGAAYDLQRQRLVVFGGSDGTNVFSTTWEWDGTDWTQRFPPVSPPARTLAGMTYDVLRGETVLFGGFDGTNHFADTWIWNGTTWTQRTVPVQPAPRKQPAMAYDAASGHTVLFGGEQGASVNYSDTWIWDGVQWTPRSPATSPGATWGQAAAFDPVRGRIVVVGGFTPSGITDDVWEWDGLTWHQQSFAPSPSTRQNAALAFWPSGEGLLFGGYLPTTTLLADTWGYRGAWPAFYAEYGSGCAGSLGVPHLSRNPNFAYLPWIGTTFGLRVTNVPGGLPALLLFGFSNTAVPGAALPLRMDFLGMPNCWLLTSFDILMPATTNGTTATLALSFPAAPSTLGTHFYGQALVFDSGINPFGAVLSNAIDAILGSR